MPGYSVPIRPVGAGDFPSVGAAVAHGLATGGKGAGRVWRDQQKLDAATKQQALEALLREDPGNTINVMRAAAGMEPLPEEELAGYYGAGQLRRSRSADLLAPHLSPETQGDVVLDEYERIMGREAPMPGGGAPSGAPSGGPSYDPRSPIQPDPALAPPEPKQAYVMRPDAPALTPPGRPAGVPGLPQPSQGERYDAVAGVLQHYGNTGEGMNVDPRIQPAGPKGRESIEDKLKVHAGKREVDIAMGQDPATVARLGQAERRIEQGDRRIDLSEDASDRAEEAAKLQKWNHIRGPIEKRAAGAYKEWEKATAAVTKAREQIPAYYSPEEAANDPVLRPALKKQEEAWRRYEGHKKQLDFLSDAEAEGHDPDETNTYFQQHRSIFLPESAGGGQAIESVVEE